MGVDLPRPRTVLLIAGLFVWFAAGVEGWRRGQYWRELRERPGLLLTEPWNTLRAFVSREGDDHLYYEYAGLMLGRPADLGYIAGKQKGEPRAARAQLAERVRPGPGWRLPYRDFPVEYPPVPLALMLLPRLVADGLPGYRVALAACLGVLFLIACWVGGRLGQAAGSFSEVEPVWRRMGWLGLATGHLLVARFDLLPAVLVAGALLALVRGRDTLAGTLGGLAFMTKLFPLLLLLPVLALLWGWNERARAVRVAAAGAGSALLVAAPFLLAAPAAFLRAVTVYGDRPFQLESLVGSLILTVRGPAAVIASFGSDNVTSPVWLGRLASAALWAALFALCTAAWRAARSTRTAPAHARAALLLRWLFAALVVVLCLSKVLSPQYLIWLLPLAAVFGQPDGRRLFRVSFALAGLTHLFFPALYGLAVSGQPIGLFALLLRNAGLVVLAVLALRAAGQLPQGWAAGGALASSQASMVAFCSAVSGPVGLPASGMKSEAIAARISWKILTPPP